MRSDYVSPEAAARVAQDVTHSNRLVLDVCGATGYRIGDVVGMRTETVEHALHNGGWLRVTEGKTGKHRSVRVKQDLLQRMLYHSNREWVFPGRDSADKHRDRTAVYKQVRKAARGEDAHITPHSWRKAYAVGVYQRTGDLERVRREMGHSNVAVTALYALADQTLAAHQKARRGRRKMTDKTLG